MKNAMHAVGESCSLGEGGYTANKHRLISICEHDLHHFKRLFKRFSKRKMLFLVFTSQQTMLICIFSNFASYCAKIFP